MTRKAKLTRPRKGRSRPRRSSRPAGPDEAGRIVEAPAEAVLTGGDVDADWMRAGSTGEEAVGGSVATPDQDVVDELGRALGVEQALDAEVRTSEEILRDRDRLRWHLARKAADDESEEAGDEGEERSTG